MHKIILTQFESVGNQDEIMYDTEIYQKIQLSLIMKLPSSAQHIYRARHISF